MTTLSFQEVKRVVEEKLKEMGCENIIFPDSKEGLVIALFNSRELTSFRYELPGWTYSGTHLDPTKTRNYKIDFIKK